MLYIERIITDKTTSKRYVLIISIVNIVTMSAAKIGTDEEVFIYLNSTCEA